MPRVIVSSSFTNTNPGQTKDGLREVDISKKIAKSTIANLRSSGLLTLSIPPDMEDKAKITWINNTGYKEEFGDIFLEIKLGDGPDSGVKTYFKESNDRSKELANTLSTEIAENLKSKSLGSFSEATKPTKIIPIIHEVLPIGIVIEPVSMGNDDDIAFIKKEENLTGLGVAIAKSVAKYLKVEFKEAAAPKPIVSPPVSAPQSAPRPMLPSNPAPAFSPINQDDDYDNIFPPRNFPPPSNPMSTFNPTPNFGGFNNSFGGGGGGFNQPGGGFGGAGAQPPQSREQRKEMIQKVYVKIMGREANQSDLNYFLNTGISEDQLIKKMIDSQEHADLVKARQEVLTTKAKFHAMNAELIQLRTETQDKSALINNLNALLAQKNVALTELQRRVSMSNPQFQGKQQSSQPQSTNIDSQVKDNFMERMFKFFSDRLG